MPESVTVRPTKSHEYLFLLTKRERYAYDADAIKEPHATRPTGGKVEPTTGRGPAVDDGRRNGNVHAYTMDPLGRNRRTVWTFTQPYKGAHFATMPERLVEPCIRAGSKRGGVVLDPFAGSGTEDRKISGTLVSCSSPAPWPDARSVPDDCTLNSIPLR
jgi:DNA modification methylase